MSNVSLYLRMYFYIESLVLKFLEFLVISMFDEICIVSNNFDLRTLSRVYTYI